MVRLLLNKLVSSLRSRRHVNTVDAPSAQRPDDGQDGTIHLALQGGGAYGAFTWGVLDHLLADDRLPIGSISGTSAGAMNAVVLADGLARGGPAAAQERLAGFWRAASIGGNLPEPQRSVVERLFSFAPRQGSPWLGALTRHLSPYDLNPLNINPLQDLIGRFVDFETFRTGDRELFITATNVLTGEPRVFTQHEITADAVMASACLPLLFRAIEIDGVPYWDGGYSGNPTLLPFLQSGTAVDVLIVQIYPRERRKAPTTNREIMTRIHELSFNASLLAELRALELAGRQLRLHRIVMDDFSDAIDARSRLDTDFEFFTVLHKLGERAARRFLDAHIGDIGQRSTIHATPENQAALA